MKHLLSMADLSADQIHDLLDNAERFAEILTRPVPKVPALRGKTVVLAFFEDSTRTRSSFDIAARRLSADVVNFSAGSSSLSKGESLRDTVETIHAMGIDAMVVRHRSSGAPQQISQWIDASIVNAGDGWHQHPTQALLDCLVLRRRLGSFEGRHIAIVGDIAHSRVARSDMEAFATLGARVTLVGPQTLMPPTVAPWKVSVAHDLDGIIDDLDAIYLLRIQNERLAEPLIPSNREFRARFGLTTARAARLPGHAVICHPGPMNLGVEIDREVTADDDRVAVLDQVAAGVPTRMAVLFHTLGPGRFESTDDAAVATTSEVSA